MTFVPEPAVLVSYAIASIVLFITPGPDMSLFLSRTVAGGRAAGFASVLGTTLGCCVHTLAAALGISALLAASGTAFTVLKVVSAVYLLWLAFDAIRNGSALNVRADKVPTANLRTHFVTGLAVNLTNPKVLLFFISFLPMFVSASDPYAAHKLFFLGLMFVAINGPLSLLLVLVAERLIEFLKARPRILKGIDWLFAGVFGFFAMSILMTQRR
jgi:threonine/homoserine/homoserine lactone efflux protein